MKSVLPLFKRIVVCLCLASTMSSILVSPASAELRPIVFPVMGRVNFSNDFGAPRVGHAHEGNDIFGAKGLSLVSTVAGRVTLVTVPEASWGFAVFIRDADNYEYRYIHMNNDNPGTDDGAGGPMHAFAPGMFVGARVNAGQLLGWLGDSGNAESTPAHLHFEIRRPDRSPMNPYESLVAAQRISAPVPAPVLEGEIVPYGEFPGGGSIDLGNLDPDSSAEIVTGAGKGGGPHVRTFEQDGTPRASFFAYTPGFTGGIDVAIGDVNGDGVGEIITAAGPGGGPHVRIFSADGSEAGGFFAYTPGFTGGVRVTAGDVDGDGRDEIITGAGPGGGPHVRIFRPDGSEVTGFFAYSPGFIGGIDVGGGDLDGNGKDDVVTGAGPGGGPHVKTFLPNGAETASFFAYAPGFTGGVKVATADMNADGKAEILTGAGYSGGPHYRILNAGGDALADRMVFESWWSGGIDVAGAQNRSWTVSGPRRRVSARRVITGPLT